ncbi:chitin-binding type-2 domain-containing protein [Caerostris extrusa]|uniref:Chitin-binding type-2 domain-containing protein n=1 Tax=Caerostris extrusa TaxID=172846 RepID=A0AAV4TH25_CAEEX|nr:chitin-binding type-2 domain-containing protein [Caerostris extrusa]
MRFGRETRCCLPCRRLSWVTRRNGSPICAAARKTRNGRQTMSSETAGGLFLDHSGTEHETFTKVHGTSSPWMPSGPPPTKLPTETPEALKKLLPQVTFDCKGKTGYFPDSKFNCEVFHYCKPDGTRNTFLCPPQSLFNQLSMVCEEKSPINSKICKEGSIGVKRERHVEVKKPSKATSKYSHKKKYKEDLSKQHRTRSAPAINNTKPRFDNMRSFEELLNYGHHKSDFYNEDGIQLRWRSSQIANIQQSIKIDREVLKPSESVLDDVSVEYDAIEGKKRKHKRVGRVLEVEDVPRLHTKGKVYIIIVKTHSHVSVRSASENPPTEDSSRSPSQSTAIRSTTLPSLFTADRSKVRDFRKRRRNLNRRRKVLKPNETTTTEIEVDETTTTTQPTPTTKQDSRTETSKFDSSRISLFTKRDILPSFGFLEKLNSTRKNVYRKAKSQSWSGSPKSTKVEPYTLPPLPVLEDEPQETTTNVIVKRRTRDAS